VTPLAPLHPSEAVQLAALIAVQLSVVGLPTMTVAGLAVSVTVGGGSVETVTFAVWLAVPPAPEHVSVNDVLAVRPEIVSLPLVLLVPVHPLDAVQLVAPVEFQLRVVVPPLVTDDGLAASAMVGAIDETVTATVFSAVPPDPAQVSV
jgi:hypothetical protein